MSESMTAKRIWAARTARRFPVILQMVARGELHLSAIVKIARHLNEDNHRSVLMRARHKSSRELDVLVAELAPRPDVSSRIRALPRSTRSVARSSGGSGSERTTESQPADVCAAQGSERTTEFQPADAGAPHGPEQAVGSCPAAVSNAPTAPGVSDSSNVPNSPNVPIAPRPRSQVVALAPRRYKVEITVDQETHDKLRMLQDLLGHQIPGADPAIIVSRAIDRLLDDTIKRKAAVTNRPRSGNQHNSSRTRAIPAAIRREVWQRDGGRCTFVDGQGRCCQATRCVEYHHDKPYGKGGEHEVDNIALRCQAHNQYQADLDFGKEFMRDKRSRNNSHSPRNVRCLFDVPL